MPVWPKSLLIFGTSLMTAGVALRLAQKRSGVELQQRTFEKLKRRLATTKFWREAGIEAGMSYDAFRSGVAPRNHAQLAPAIQRMQAGEANVLWPGRCAFFASTAGISEDEPRLLPVTAEMLAHFRRGARHALLYYTSRVGHAGVFRGRHLFLGGPTATVPLATAKTGSAYVAGLDGVIALSRTRTAEKHLYEPGAEIGAMADGLAKFDAIAARATHSDISLLAGPPHWVHLFANGIRDGAARQQRRIEHLQGLWPNLECFIHSGTLGTLVQNELRAALGPKVSFHEVYASCEGYVAAQDAAAHLGLRLMADLGLFFEFLPMSEFDEARLDQLGTKAVPLAEVKVGVEYAPLLTTPAGLARYLLGDVVRFVSTSPPRLVYVGRTNLRLNAFGEHVTERELTEALAIVSQRHGWSVVNFHTAPMFATNLTGQQRGRHEWWVELRPGTKETPIGPHLGTELDAELQRLNTEYAARRKAGVVEAPIVRLVMPGVFEHWLRFRQKWGGQHKTPHCRSDRQVADELSQITNFARD